MSKVLVIANNSFSKTANNGKTYEAIFSEFKKDDIAQVFFSKNEEPDFDFCDNYFKITDEDVFLNLIKFSFQRGNRVKNEIDVPLNVNGGRVSIIFNFLKKYADKLVLLRDVLWGFKSWRSPQLKEWLNEFNPDVVFFVGGEMVFPHKIALWVADFLNKPLVVYFTDDYVIYPKARNILDTITKFRARNIYKKTIDKASLHFTIGEIMAKEYSSFYNKRFLYIMNSVDILELETFKKNYDSEESQKIVISYFGGLHLKRDTMLCHFAMLLDVNKYEINVFSMQKPSQEMLRKFHDCGVNFKGGVTGDLLKENILSSDILLHVESDEKYYRSLTKLSISTKIPEYLVTGKLIVGYGPKELASMKILDDNEIGIVIDSSEIKMKILSKLCKMEDKVYRKTIGERGKKFAIRNFNRKTIATDFKAILESIKIKK